MKGRTEVESNQPIPPSAQELRRQKVVQDTVRTRQEARRNIDAKISRVDSAVNTEAAGELRSRPSYRAKSGADAPRTPSRFAEKPGKAEGKAARPRISGGRAPSKPAFALKERAAAGRQLQTNTATAAQQAKRAVAQKLQRQMVRKNAENAQKVTKQAARLTVKATKAVVGAVKSAVSSVAAIGGAGAVLVVMLVVIALIAAIVASPFGIFFSNESASSDTVPLSAAVAQVNFDFNARLEELQGADTYDDITVDGSTADWVEILAVFAAKVAGSDGTDAADVATIDADRVERLKAVFWDMNALTSEVETIDHPDSDPDDDTDDTRTRGQTKGRNGSSSTNYQQAGRELMMIDELRMMDTDDALLLIRGERPVMDKKYNIFKHPNFARTERGGAKPYVHRPTPDYALPDLPYQFTSLDDIEILEENSD